MMQFKSKLDVSTLEEIYAEIASRQVAALMFHRQMADYFDFLGLRGYKRMHEYQYYSESVEARKLSRYYINHHGQLIPDKFEGTIAVIPSAWSTAKRISVGRATKQKAVEDGFNQYHAWETETKSVYEMYAKKLRELGFEADAIFVDKMVEDVDIELKYLTRQIVDLVSAGYDMIYIVTAQTELHECYRRKTEELRRET
jgi:hypothetical protein